MSVGAIVYREIHKHRKGLTSAQVCDLHPEIPRRTITSSVAKLRKKGLLYGEMSEGIQVLFSDKNAPIVRGPIPKKSQSTEASSTLDKEVTLKALKPFADFAKLMLKNKPFGNSSVWLSATTQTPTVQIADAKWFMDALALVEALEKN